MKVNLVVMTAGKMQGKSIAITMPEFIIGRDPGCHLRPASPMISKKHCAVTISGESASVRDFGSTNGTMVNNHKVETNYALANGDVLKVGPLEFRVELQAAATGRLTPPPQSGASREAEDAAAALFLSLGDESTMNSPLDSQGVPTGSTIMETMRLQTNPAAADPAAAATPSDPAAAGAAADPSSKPGDRMNAAKAQNASTSSAAKAILEKYMRRPRG